MFKPLPVVGVRSNQILAPFAVAALLLAGCAAPPPTMSGCDEAPNDGATSAGGMRFAADAGADQEARAGDRVTLDGSASRHLDGRPLSYRWYQVTGPCAPLDDVRAVKPSFTMPPGGDVLVFRLYVSSEGVRSAPDDAEVHPKA